MKVEDLDKEAIVAIEKLLEEFKVDVPSGYRAWLKLAWIRGFHSGWKYATERWTEMIDEMLPKEGDIKKELEKIREQTQEQPKC